MSELAQVSGLRHALAASETYADLATVAKLAVSVRDAMSRAGHALEMVNEAGEIYLEALYQCGEMMQAKGPGGDSRTIRLDQPNGLGSSARHSAQKLCRWLPDVDAIGKYVVEATESGTQATAAALLAKYKPPPPEPERVDEWVPPTITTATAIDWLEDIPEQSVDLLLTDPPYMTDVDDVAEFAAEWFPLALSRVKPTGRAYVFIGSYPSEMAAYLTVQTGGLEMRDVLVWSYTNTLGPKPARTYIRNWQAILHLVGEDAPALRTEVLLEQVAAHEVAHPAHMPGRLHQWEKPLSLSEMFVLHATEMGDSVIDPFSGTGTMLMAAGNTGRHGRGCDQDDSMVEICRKRGCISPNTDQDRDTTNTTNEATP